MRDLRSPALMWMKAALFLAIGLLSSVLILVEWPDWRLFGLLLLVVWSFCRAYYFCFYVLERYVDPSLRYAGLGAMIGRLLRGKSRRAESKRDGAAPGGRQ